MILNIKETTEKCIDCGAEFVPLRGEYARVTMSSKLLCFDCQISNLKWLISHNVDIINYKLYERN